ncbi:MAG: hypothetical protein RMK74_14660 [Myxococcales bacterium]|nr:hypothetical protein [Myxococcales bacterium]
MVTTLVLVAAPPVPIDAQRSEFWAAIRDPAWRDARLAVAAARRAIAAGEAGAALEHATRAVQRAPARAPAWVALARSHALGERFAEACAAAEQALSIDPAALDAPDDAFAIAEAAIAGARWPLAARILDRAAGLLEPSRRRAELFAMRGDVALAMGPAHLPEALAAYREAVRQLGRDEPQAGIGLALALWRSGARDEALQLAQEVAARGRPPSRTLDARLPQTERAARRALLAQALGDLEAAEVLWREAGREGPWALADERSTP